MNLSKDTGKPTNSNFQLTIVWGHSFEFSPSIINYYWNCFDILDNEVKVLETNPMVFVIIGRNVEHGHISSTFAPPISHLDTPSCIRL